MMRDKRSDITDHSGCCAVGDEKQPRITRSRMKTETKDDLACQTDNSRKLENGMNWAFRTELKPGHGLLKSWVSLQLKLF